MKRFHELTKDQRDAAIQYAIGELTDCVEIGLIKFNPGHLSASVINDYAIAAAEEAWYSERSDKIVADIVEE